MAEASLLSISEIHLRAWNRDNDTRVPILRKLIEGNVFLSAIVVGVNVCVIVVSTVTTVLLSQATTVHGLYEELAHIGMLFFMLIVAEIAPKTYGALYPDKVALRVATKMWRIVTVSALLMRGIDAISFGFLRLLGVTILPESSAVTRDELRVAADVSEEEGALEPEEGEMLDSVLELSIARANEVMVPRVDIVALPLEATREQILNTITLSGFSRIPIYSGTMDTIIGILYINDLLRVLKDGVADVNIGDISREPVYVPESKPLDELLADMRERAVHIAIVVDEYGGTEGLITIEDILEELVGEIEDEHDTVTYDTAITMLSSDEAIVHGRERIEVVNQRLGANLPEDEWETIGGLTSGLANRIPVAHESFEIGGVRLIVEEADEQHIERIRVAVIHRDGGEDNST